MQYGAMDWLSPQTVLPQPPLAEPLGGDAFDEAAFERAFEFARAALETQSMESQPHAFLGSQQARAVLPTETEADASLQGAPGLRPEVGTFRIGADAIPDARNEESGNREEDRTELAITAGQLLENVKDDTSHKFRNSTFLNLMRRLRDGEATVKGQDIVQVG